MANRIIEGKYEILKELGTGGMSTVWLASDLNLDKLWAIKEINKSTAEYKATVNENKAIAEIRIMKDLDHPLLPRIVDVIDKKDTLFVIMDYIEGKTLKKVLEMTGPIDEELVVGWMLDICNIFTYLHKQNPPIIYRDLKPANIMLKPDGTIRLIDFGIARELKDNAGDTKCLGTQGYASPEHFTGNTTERSDIFTIGSTMYHLITGIDPTQPPYEIRPLREINEKFSSGLEQIIEKCLQPNPEKRYQTTEELKEDLENYKKLEIPYLNSLKKKINTFKVLVFISLLCIFVGTGLLIADKVISNSKYDALINTQDTNQERKVDALTKAINLQPERADAYMVLIEEYMKNGFNEEEATEFLAIFNKNREKIKKHEEEYQLLNYHLGEAFLVYYTGETDDSIRNKLFVAEPFFAAAANDETEEGILALGYENMANFYKKYIIGDNALIGQDKDRGVYEKALKTCKDMLHYLDQNKVNHKASHKQIHLALTSYELILHLLDEEKSSFAKTNMDIDALLAVVHEIDKKTRDTENCCELGMEKKKKIITNCNLLEERIQITYNNEKKEEGGKRQ